jgi:hypothetical protein
MKKVLTYIILFSILLTLSNFITPKIDDNKILWSNKQKLNWDNFVGIPDTTKINIVASTCCKIEVTDSKIINGIPIYVLECNFIKNESWKIVNDDYTLNHEQLHFDIYELYTRKIRKTFDSLNRKKVQDFKIYDKFYYNYGDKCSTYNDLYDSQVYFSEENQKKWNKKINCELLKLKKYEYIPEE